MITVLTDIGTICSPNPQVPYQIERPLADTLVIEDGMIRTLGRRQDLTIPPDSRVLAVDGRLVTPGFVDCHQHPLFAAHRHQEFEMRNLGRTYQDIATAGGGIRSSVRTTRSADRETLSRKLTERWRQALQYGTTTVEAKSGYGLSLEHEIRSLEIIRDTAESVPLTVTRTLLAAHDVPDEYRQDREEYISIIIEEIIPRTAAEHLADSVDIFCEEGVYSVEESRRILSAGKARGLQVRLHADQLAASGGSHLAAELGALSADHLEEIDEEGIRALVAADVTAVLIPTSTLFLRMPRYAPARRIIDAGGRIALATNYNPGSSMFISQVTVMTLAALIYGLSTDEVLWAATMGGATVLGMQDRIASIRPGYRADLLVWDVEDPGEIPYQPNLQPSQRMIAGKFLEP